MSSQIRKAAVMGWPVEHSLSPRLHGYWLKKYNITGTYEALAVKPENLATELRALKSRGLTGVNLTVPHKETALAIVDRLDPVAKRIGAVNTIVVQQDGTLEGRNTDAYGFAQNLISGGYTQKHDAPVVILGAGGAARAAIAALQDLGAHDIRIVNRSVEKAQKLAQEFSNMEQSHFVPAEEPIEDAIDHIHRVTAFAWNDVSAVLKNTALLINATSLGLKGQPPLEIDLEPLPQNAFVTDMVYAPLMTNLLLQAQRRGNRIIDGLGMLLHQARPAFHAFFGTDPEVTEELRRYVLEGVE